MPTDEKKKVLLGRITGAHGLRGEVRAQTFTARPKDIAAYGPLISGSGLVIEIAGFRPIKDGAVILRLKGVTDRNAAEALEGEDLFLPRERLPLPAEDEFYHADLIGLEAVKLDGASFGKVIAVQNFGAGDLIEIRLAASNKTELIPFTAACVPEIDLPNGRIIVNPPESF